ncbi:glutamate--cysteine ligase [Undibacterium squillarum]|uniref:Glutamate--cysteine ligase n=1 Tax=Undibacterium squillarum TaxID=1131567 RepID=A0ABQ2Y150_9BURK|nr:glutamate--cysteine ligase [Undibacterium squillarum]GGX47980.1 glutamate--cysteine ligase [Undibacterium squillarum]
MSKLLTERLALLSQPEHLHVLGDGLRGIERETLRVRQDDGALSLRPHPVALGATLTHPEITTDYAEALLEFITPALPDISAVLERLDQIHRFVHANLGEEMLWSQSMPGELPSEEAIPIAWYGTSHIGMIKHVYRRGLALRYGKTMQCIAGIHYNFSLSPDVWKIISKAEGRRGDAQYLQSESYVALIRNFHRTSWLLMYLFGASPAIPRSFLRGAPHTLETLSDDTLYLPYATSLRMSDLGYQNNAQDGLVPPYNTLLEYMRSLSKAVRKPYPPYEAIGTRKDGEWVQINTNVLQIENEFYATIRPKQVIRSGERAVEALCARGVQYIEVRCMDVNPFDPLGISLETARFLDVFLTYCALQDSPLTSEAEGNINQANFSATVREGRRPGLMLQRGEQQISLQAWGLDLIAAMEPVAALLDQQHGGSAHRDSLAVQKARLVNPELTPSAQVLQAITEHGNSYVGFGLAQSQQLAQQFRDRPLSTEQTQGFTAAAQQSLQEQSTIEQQQSGDFDSFIQDYRSRTSEQICCDE